MIRLRNNLSVENTLRERYVKLTSLGLDISFVVLHLVMLLLFYHHGVWPMFYFNIGSVILYLFLPLLLFRDRFSLFVQLMHLEVAVHMTLAIYFVGWNCGFQIAGLGFNVFLAYAEYLATSLNMKRVHSLRLCAVTMILYIGICVVDYHRVTPYPLPPETAYGLRLLWAASVLTLTIFFLQLFAYLASNVQKQLSEEALHDKLTGLPNRYYMADYLDRTMLGGDSGGHWIAIADIDDFKQVNDLYGHNCGDYVLKTLAELTRSHEPKVEVCRWGGEEFLLVGSLEAGPEAALNDLNRLRRQVENYPFLYGNQALRLTITVGVAFEQPGEGVDAWINRADMKLYGGKNSGKNKVMA